MRNNNKKRNGIIAAVLGAALLMGGSTFALWSVTANLGVGNLSTGQMAITPDGSYKAYDISEDNTGNAEVFAGQTGLDITADFATFKMVPGDKIALVYDYTVILEGDNLKADLYFDFAGFLVAIEDGDDVSLDTSRWDISYSLTVDDVLVNEHELSSTDPLNGDNPLEPGDGNIPVSFVLIIEFDKELTTGVQDMNLLLTAAENATLTLLQNRG